MLWRAWSTCEARDGDGDSIHRTLLGGQVYSWRDGYIVDKVYALAAGAGLTVRCTEWSRRLARLDGRLALLGPGPEDEDEAWEQVGRRGAKRAARRSPGGPSSSPPQQGEQHSSPRPRPKKTRGGQLFAAAV